MNLYRLARLLRTLTNPTPRRLSNVVKGRVLARLGFWRWLYGGKKR